MANYKKISDLRELESDSMEDTDWFVVGSKYSPGSEYDETKKISYGSLKENLQKNLNITGGGEVFMGDVLGADIASDKREISVKWSDPEDIIYDDNPLSVWQKTVVVRKEGSAPSDADDGTVVVENTVRGQYASDPLTDTVDEYGTYYYRFFVYSQTGLLTKGTTLSVMPEKEKISVVPTVAGTLYYTGNPQTPKWNDYDPEKLEIGGDIYGTWTGNAGFTNTTTFTPNHDYTWSDGTEEAKSVTWSIEKVPCSCDLPEVSQIVIENDEDTVDISVKNPRGIVTVLTYNDENEEEESTDIVDYITKPTAYIADVSYLVKKPDTGADNSMQFFTVFVGRSDYEITDFGLLATNDDAIGTSLNIDSSASNGKLFYNKIPDLSDNIEDYFRKNPEKKHQSVIYKWSKKDIEVNDMWYARGYLKYKDENGNESVKYGEITTAIRRDTGEEHDIHSNSTADGSKCFMTTLSVTPEFYNDSVWDLSFLFGYRLSSGNTFIGTGMVITDDSSVGKDITIESESAVLGNGNRFYNKFAEVTEQSYDSNGNPEHTFKWTKGDAGLGTHWYVRPYVRFTESDGTERLYYGDTCEAYLVRANRADFVYGDVKVPIYAYSPNGTSGKGSIRVACGYPVGTYHYSNIGEKIGVTVNGVSSDIYGAEWDGTSTTKWSRTDAAEGFTDPIPAVNNGTGSSPFDDIMPWAGMKIVENSEAGTLVEIPKFYYKWTRDGVKMKLQISMNEFEGSFVSPAHADRGDGRGERELVYHGRYHCAESTYKSTTGVKPRVTMTRADFRQNIHNLGSTVWQRDFATYWTVAMLYLVEFADWNSQATIGHGCGNGSNTENMGATDAMQYHTGTDAADRTTYGHTQYRYIEDLWGNVFDWCDGIYFSGANVYCIKNPADFSDTTGGTLVGQRATSSNYISGYTAPSADGFEYALYPNAIGGNASTYVCDVCGYGSYDAPSAILRVGGAYRRDPAYGLFYLNGNVGASYTFSNLGSRLMVLP